MGRRLVAVAMFISETGFRADVADYLATTQMNYTLLYPTFYYSVSMYLSVCYSYSDQGCLESFRDGMLAAAGVVFLSYEVIGSHQSKRWVRSHISSLANRWPFTDVRLC